MIRLRTPSAVQHPSPIPNHHTYVELHLRPTARLRCLLHHTEAITAAAAAAPAAAAASSRISRISKQQKLLQQQEKQQQQQRQRQQQQQQQEEEDSGGGGGGSSRSNGSSYGDSTSPAILLPSLPKPRSLSAAVGFAFPFTTQTRRPINIT